MNRRQRRLLAAKERQIAPRQARVAKLLGEAREALDEVQTHHDRLVHDGIEEKRVEGVEYRLTRNIDQAVMAQAQADRLLEHVRSASAVPGPSGIGQLRAARQGLSTLSTTAARSAQKWDAQRVHEDLPIIASSTFESVPERAKRILALSQHLQHFDELLAEWGRIVWEVAHCTPDYDAEARIIVSEACRERTIGYLIAETLMFSSVWAVDAFQQIATSHTFAAALMCSDPDRGALEAIEKQWRAFAIMVPDGLLTLDWENDQGQNESVQLARILVSVDDASAKMILCYPFRESDPPVMGFTPLQAPTFADLLLDDPTSMLRPGTSGSLMFQNGVLVKANSQSLKATEQEVRATRMVQRLVAGLLLAMQHTKNFRERTVTPRTVKDKRTASDPSHRLIHVGRPLDIDLRPNVQEYIRTGKTGRRHGGPPTVQVLVRGHYRRQVHGTGRLLRKVIWIEPFWRGPEEATIQVRPKLKT